MRTQRWRATLHRGAWLLAFVSLAACRDRPPPQESQPPPPVSHIPAPPLLPEGPSWCGQGFKAIDEDTCFAAPERLASPPVVVFFAHGIMAPDAIPEGDLAALREASSEQGFVAVVPRGKQGLCTWSADVAGSYCWPTRRDTIDDAAPALLSGWGDAQARIEDALDVRFERRYVLGFSNGGYFAAYLGLEGLLPVDGVGVVGAGRSAVDESRLAPRRPPFYIAVGGAEAEVTRKDAEQLSTVLSLRQWPVEYVVDPGRGHELRAADFERAWSTWQGPPKPSERGAP